MMHRHRFPKVLSFIPFHYIETFPEGKIWEPHVYIFGLEIKLESCLKDYHLKQGVIHKEAIATPGHNITLG